MIVYIAGRISGKKDYKKDFAAAAWLFGMTNRWFRSVRPKSTAKHRAWK